MGKRIDLMVLLPPEREGAQTHGPLCKQVAWKKGTPAKTIYLVGLVGGKQRDPAKRSKKQKGELILGKVGTERTEMAVLEIGVLLLGRPVDIGR